ncbi:cyclic di-AMP binding protein CbpA [Lysinibacillus piscis]|uniref:CBS domain-containing protein n=1 Tax=Lysinibacillus piscis TaxID=2518931 RepID=A0ABQ5NJJ4_9BACI|nr:cyclic di-AMP binding protein CbpA [Lysinibacillus sp. KH24]GLC88472.1 CBS domain-containing protein [Lysinibacillus sp. KH24]
MLVKQKQLKKNDVVFVKETDSVAAVLETLYDSGYRCIPVLDTADGKFVGNIYKVVILEYKLKDGDMTVPIKQLVQEAEAYVHENSSFFEVFDSIKELPYLAVVNTKGQFAGILPHSKVFELLEEAWGYKTGSCALTIALPDTDGILAKVLTALRKIWPLHCVFSLDDETTYLRRIIITLSKGATESHVANIEAALLKQGARIIDIEVFDKDNF